MKFDPRIHHRRSIRLPGYDYTQPGAYYITIVTYQRQNVFGEIIGGQMRWNKLGQIAHDEWFKTALLRPYVTLYEDQFVVMPNHVHGIVWIENGDGGDFAAIAGARRRRAPAVEQFGKPVPGSIPTIVRAYKSAVTYASHAMQLYSEPQLWQRNYHEHVIRDERDLQRKCDYILANPLNWETDEQNTARQRS